MWTAAAHSSEPATVRRKSGAPAQPQDMAWLLLGVAAAAAGEVVELRPIEYLGWMLITIALSWRYFAHPR